MKKIILFAICFTTFLSDSVSAQSRWISYFNHCKSFYGTSDSVFNVLWFNRDVTSWNGFTLDTFSLPTNALVVHPQTSELNGIDYLGELNFSASNTYQVDSAIIYGIYIRNSNLPNVVDTLRVSLVSSDATVNSNLPQFYFTGQFMNYGYDTVRFHTPYYDSVRKTFRKATAASPNVITQDILLTPASLNDTLSNGIHAFKINFPNPFVGANQKFAISTTFRSGASYPLYDSLWNGTTWKYNVFAPFYYEQQTNSFPIYTPDNFNHGCLQVLPLSNGWNNQYIPMYAFNSPSVDIEFPHVDVKLICSTCDTIASQIYANWSTTFQQNINACNSILLTTTSPAPVQLQWMLNGTNINGATSNTYVATQSGTYVLKQTFNGVVAYSKPVYVTINNITVIANANSTSICSGDTITLWGSGIANSPSYTWNLGVVNNQPFTPTNSAVYTVLGTDANGCTATSSIAITVNPSPNPVIIQMGNNLSTTLPYVSYQWYLNGVLISGATSQIYTPSQNGPYSVLVTDPNGCDAISSAYLYLTVATDDLQQKLGVMVFPNPTQDVLHIHFNNTPFNAQIKLKDLQGRSIWEKEGDFTSDEIINLSKKPKGTYFLELQKNNQKFYFKILIL